MKKLIASTLVLTVLSSVVFAGPMGFGIDPSSAAMANLAKVLSKQSITAHMEMTVEAKGGKSNPGTMDMVMTMSGGKSRVEMDFAKIAAAASGKAAQMPAGMDKMISISRPDKHVMYQIMPGMKAYCEMAIPEAQQGVAKGETPTVERKVEGEETVDGHKCEKVSNTITSESQTIVVYTWEAKDLSGLPVKVVTDTQQGKATMIMKDIKSDKPADSMFEPPAGYTKYNSMQEMIMSEMMKSMPHGE